MGYGKISATEALLWKLSENFLIVDREGQIHWWEPRNGSDSRPWTNREGKRVLARNLRAVPGPRWGELHRLVRRLQAAPQRLPRPNRAQAAWGGSTPEKSWGWRLETWRHPGAGRRGGALRATVWLLDARDSEVPKAARRLYDALPADCLTWAVRMGLVREDLERQRALARAWRAAEVG